MNRTNSFNSFCLSNISHKFPNSEPIDDNHVKSNKNVDSLTKNDIKRRAISIVMNAQYSDFKEYMLRNSGSSAPNTNPILEE